MTARLFEVLYALLERRQVRAGELAERLGVSVRTVYRDVEALSAAGIPVYACRGHGGGIALMEGFTLSRAALSEGEKDALLMGVKGLAASEQDARSALRKLSGLFTREAQDWLEVDLSSWGAAGVKDERFALLRSALRERRVVTFSYRGADGSRRMRRVWPARLCFKASAWYLQAWCCEREAYRTFRLSRMSDVRATQERFLDGLPDAPDIDVAWWGDAPPEEVVVRIAPEAAFRAMDDFAPAQLSEGPDGSVTARLFLPAGSALLSFLLSYGDALEVLAPETARTRLREMALRVAQRYESGQT